MGLDEKTLKMYKYFKALMRDEDCGYKDRCRYPWKYSEEERREVEE